MKKHLVYIGIGLFTALVYVFIQYRFPFPQAGTPSSVKNYYHNWLEEQEKNVWNLLATYKITPSDYENYKNKSKEEYSHYIQEINSKKRAGPALSKQTLEIVDRVFNDFNVNKNEISVRSYISEGASCASAHDTVLFIDEQLLSKLPYKAQLFVLAHELSHALFKDQEFGYILFYLFPPYEKAAPIDHPLNIIHRFQELRADMNASAKSLDYVQGSILLCNEYYKQYGPGKGETHPTIPDRVKEGKKLLALYTPGQQSSSAIV